MLTLLTGSPYFPGGLGEFHCLRNQYLVFEDGPSVDVTLQWASYYDAADQSALSRIWGGIHPGQDDLPSRRMGSVIGIDAFHFAKTYFDGEAGICPFGNDNLDTDADAIANACDRCPVSTPAGACDCAPEELCCREGCLIADANGDGTRDLLDLAAFQNCFSGSAGTTPVNDCLFHFAIDSDDDIDLDEFSFFQARMAGPLAESP